MSCFFYIDIPLFYSQSIYWTLENSNNESIWARLKAGGWFIEQFYNLIHGIISVLGLQVHIKVIALI